LTADRKEILIVENDAAGRVLRFASLQCAGFDVAEAATVRTLCA
jgi:hypothetical protein